ncbi:AAA family ATPase [Actinopolymorpha rutila]|uniref:Nuclease SbcCD subunit C n=1 Tax=Actinopolymorpha rutila TaxID=446787 RepID=A0A852Z5T6_9ACTN|nr:DNA sulfur modification protein DndD [Actinopolymorpha rutila]
MSLKNFGPYRHIDSLSLDTHPDSPVVVIHGENTLGKTRLFRALRWCLYGSLLPQQSAAAATQQLPGYLNRLAAHDGENVMEVSMKFRANGQPYSLVRRATIERGTANVSTDLRIGPTVVQQASIESEIGRLLHPQISEFFLFDGELLKDFYDRLNTDRERDFIRGSIDTVLGIPALQRGEADIADLAEDAVQRQAKAVRNVKESARISREMRELSSRQESIEKDRQEIQRALRQAKLRLAEVKESVGAVGELQADAREQETLEAAIEGGKQQEDRLRAEMRQLLTVGWRTPALGKLVEALERVQMQNNAANSRQQAVLHARARIEVLREQLAGGNCVTCNQPLPPPDPTTHQQLEDAERNLEDLGAEAADGPDLVLERRIMALIDRTTAERYREKQSELNAVVSAQFDRTRRVNALKDRLKDNSAAKIRALGDEQERLDSVIDGFEQRLKTFVPRLSDIATKQQRLARSLSRIPGAQPAVAAESVFFEYVRTLLGRTIERYQERTRAEVEKTASEMFLKLVRDPQGYQGLRIGRDYRVDLLGSRGQHVDTSEGGKQLVALSLIGALKLAAVRGGPVVLDSPLARLDLEHRENVLNTWVTSLGNQAVLLVQSGELTEENARQILGSRIGHEYRIVRPRNDPDEAQIERTQ